MKSISFFLIGLTLFSALVLFLTTPHYVQAEGGTAGINNPIGDNNMDAEDLIVRLLTGFLGILSLFALVMVIYGGFQYIYSAGNPEQVKKAKDTIVWALIGMAIAFLSLAIVNFVIDAFRGAS